MAQTAYIFEAGSCLVLDGEELWLTGDYQPSPEATIHQQIEVSDAPAMLLQTYAGRLEYHDPWHHGREVSHLFRGLVDAREVTRGAPANRWNGTRSTPPTAPRPSQATLEPAARHQTGPIGGFGLSVRSCSVATGRPIRRARCATKRSDAASAHCASSIVISSGRSAARSAATHHNACSVRASAASLAAASSGARSRARSAAPDAPEPAQLRQRAGVVDEARLADPRRSLDDDGAAATVRRGLERVRDAVKLGLTLQCRQITSPPAGRYSARGCHRHRSATRDTGSQDEGSPLMRRRAWPRRMSPSGRRIGRHHVTRSTP